MYERIMSTGRTKKQALGGGNTHTVVEYEILDKYLRAPLETVWGIDEAKARLESIIREERAACPTGSCED